MEYSASPLLEEINQEEAGGTVTNDLGENIVRIAERDDDSAQAFDVLYESFHKLIFSVVYKVLNNIEDTQDTCQEVWTNVWKRAWQFDGEKGKPISWLSAMARNRAIDVLRSKERRAGLNSRFEASLLPEDRVEDVTPDRLAEIHSEGEILQEDLAKLPDEQRIPIEMAYFQGRTQSEIQKELNIPLGTIKARMRRGMVQLRLVRGIIS